MKTLNLILAATGILTAPTIYADDSASIINMQDGNSISFNTIDIIANAYSSFTPVASNNGFNCYLTFASDKIDRRISGKLEFQVSSVTAEVQRPFHFKFITRHVLLNGSEAAIGLACDGDYLNSIEYLKSVLRAGNGTLISPPAPPFKVQSIQ